MDSPRAAPSFQPDAFLNNKNIKIFTLIVRPDEERIMVHKGILCGIIPYFARAFRSNFQESVNSIMKLPEDDPKAIAVLMHWVYLGEIPKSNTVSYIHTLYNLYIVAVKFCVQELKYIAMDEIQDMATCYDLKMELCTYELVLLVMDSTLEDQFEGLRRFVVGAFAYFSGARYPGHVVRPSLLENEHTKLAREIARDSLNF